MARRVPRDRAAPSDVESRESEHAARLEEHDPFRLGPITALSGVGPARAAKLQQLGLRDLRDVLLLMPVGLDAWPAPVAVAALEPAAAGLQRVAGRVARSRFRRSGGRRSLLTLVLEDDSGTLEVLFFNQAWLRERLRPGEPLEVAGRMTDTGRRALVAVRLGTPQRPLPAPGALVPRYLTTDGIGQEFLRRLCRACVRDWAAALEDPIPRERLERHALLPLSKAARALHEPASVAEHERGRRRVALEPLLHLQARLVARRAQHDAGRAVRLAVDAELRAKLARAHPFTLTASQRAANTAIERDLARTRPMRRLLLGDVGTGKTAVALHAALVAAGNGAQAAFLAPTELLAEQHAGGLGPRLDALGVRHALLTGSQAPALARTIKDDLRAGRLDLVFGTHALLSADVAFAALALAIVDEQHRFGVDQRQRLLDKGRDVHALFLSATPIPRSLAQTLYADLELTTLDERPPGRGRVTTSWLRGDARRGLGRFLDQRLAAGERAYWVCPRIGGAGDALDDGDGAEAPGASGAGGAVGVEERALRLRQSALARHGIGVVHGRLAADERAAVLERFRSGALALVVATTVVEVGVDVPEATVIVIEGAERFGLAQLHQLRGRVGRGPRDSHCLLLGSGAGSERLALLEATDDGLAIAEADLAQRGMGELLGRRQAGLNPEGLGDPRNASELCATARALIAADPDAVARYLAGAPRELPLS